MKYLTPLLLLGLVVCCPCLVRSDCSALTDMKLAQSINEFGLKLLAKVPDNEVDNVLISPVSLINPLNMLLLGTSQSSDQSKELRKVLQYDNLLSASSVNVDTKQLMSSLRKASDNTTVTISNMLAVNKKFITLKQSYVSQVKDDYKAQIEEFSPNEKVPIADYVNKWISKETNGMISQLVNQKSLNNKESALALINAVYFKGLWDKGFDEHGTRDGQFTNIDGSSKTVETMFKSARYSYLSPMLSSTMSKLDSSAISLPYKGGDYDMIVILPNKLDGVQSLQDSLTYANLLNITNELDGKSKLEVDLSLPKFTIENTPNVQEALQQMGLESVFKTGEYPNMADGLFSVSSIVHKTKIEVDEKGTKAAAATVIVITRMSIRINPKFTVDHPFLFMIRHVKSNTILFLGRVNKL